MAKSTEWSTKQLTPCRRAWVRLLQALGKTSGEGSGTEGAEHSARPTDSGTSQRTARLPEISAQIISLEAEKERIKQQLREAMSPPCPNKVRQIVTQSFRAIQLEEIKGNG